MAAVAVLAVLASGALPMMSAAADVQSTLTEGQSLSAGQALWSGPGGYEAIMQGDGNFVVYAPGGAALWATHTSVPGSSIILQGDGNLVVYAPGGKALWASHTAGDSDVSAVMQGDGNFVLYGPGSRPLWSSMGGLTGLSTMMLYEGQRLYAGQALWSGPGGYEAVMQGDGNFVVYAPGGAALWATHTSVPGSSIILQGDGNLVVYAPGGKALWASSTGGGNGALVMQGDSNLVIYFAGVPLWSSNRSHGATRGYNGFTAGYCTWYAAQRWDQATGSFPGFNGNAYQWASNARTAGYTVTSRPEPRSVVVFPQGPGAQYLGHVAWVDSVTRNSNGSISVHIDEMNVNGLGVIDSRTITNSSSLQYILVPY
jgi:surface antigen